MSEPPNLDRRSLVRMAGAATAGLALAKVSPAAAATRPDVLTGLTLAEASRLIRARQVTPSELTEASFARIDVYGRKLNAFITLTRDQALASARTLDAEQKAGRLRGPLHGVPIAVKDLIDTAGVRTTAASAVFADRVPTEDAFVVERLKTAGAVIVGKTNLQEFAFGAGELSAYGPARNPWSLDRGTGGSSSGSGAAVAADLCFGALGTDTAGSIRQPACQCGIVGLKPTYGLVSLRGVIPLIPSLDHCGPMARTVEDVAIMLEAIASYDRLDPASVERAPVRYTTAMRQPVSGFRLGLPEGYFDDLDPQIAEAVDRAVKLISGMTRGGRSVRLPPTAEYAAGSGLGAETYAYQEPNLKRDPDAYLPPIRKRFQAMAKWTAADYVRARQGLERLRRSIDASFADVDLIVAPSEKGLAPPLNAMIERSLSGQPGLPGSATSNLAPFDVYGLPAISVPCGFSREGLPIGLMIAGPRLAEGKVLALAAAYERAAGWGARRPPLTPDMPVPAVGGYDWRQAPLG